MTVFANGLEISAKKQGGKVIAAFPDTCFTPPQTPATPPGVPVPYPNFGNDGDLISGTGTVKIGGETVSQENSSKFSKCSGDEAGSAPKKGIITSKNTGEVYAQKWSMDVKFEGKGVVRFSDIATSNHACTPGDSPPWPHMATANVPGAVVADVNCIVGEYDIIKKKCREGGGETHHVVPDMVYRVSTRRATPRVAIGAVQGQQPPSIGSGMCICLKKEDHSGLHSDLNRTLHDLGVNNTPPHTAPVKLCVRESMRSLLSISGRRSDDNPMSKAEEDCIKTACRAAREQSEPFRNQNARTNPYRTPTPGTDTYTVLTQTI